MTEAQSQLKNLQIHVLQNFLVARLYEIVFGAKWPLRDYLIILYIHFNDSGCVPSVRLEKVLIALPNDTNKIQSNRTQIQWWKMKIAIIYLFIYCLLNGHCALYPANYVFQKINGGWHCALGTSTTLRNYFSLKR